MTHPINKITQVRLPYLQPLLRRRRLQGLPDRHDQRRLHLQREAGLDHRVPENRVAGRADAIRQEGYRLARATCAVEDRALFVLHGSGRDPDQWE